VRFGWHLSCPTNRLSQRHATLVYDKNRSLDATLCTSLLCDIISVFDVHIKNAHKWQTASRIDQICARQCGKTSDIKTHIENAHKRRKAHSLARRSSDLPDMQVRRRFLSHYNNVACNRPLMPQRHFWLRPTAKLSAEGLESTFWPPTHPPPPCICISG
jgi:hypothetical protein